MYEEPVVVKAKRFKNRTLVAGVKCPECGCGMAERVGGHGAFYGCERFPICVGARPGRDFSRKPWDSYTELLLDAHKDAVTYMSKAHVLGSNGGIAWWLNYPLLLTSTHVLESALEAASIEASKYGESKDFIQAAHDRRISKVRTRWANLFKTENLKDRPKPVFTRRWDNSLAEQIEIDLTPVERKNRR